MRKLALLASMVCVVLAGCASGPDFKTYNSTLNAPKDGESRIWFYRPGRVFASALRPMVYINGTPIANAEPGSFFYADRPPGTYELRCTTEWPNRNQLTVVENRVAYVRLSSVPGVVVGHILPRVVTEDKALREIQSCHLNTAYEMNKNWKTPEVEKTNSASGTAPQQPASAP